LLACLPLDPGFAGSDAAEDDEFPRAIKIPHDFRRSGSIAVGIKRKLVA
jgi:hypothetical protein